MNKKKKTHVPLRLNFLFFIVFCLFAALIVRLGLVQIVYGEDYVKEVNRTENLEVSVSVPRGVIYDRDHRTIVDNVAKNAITYTKPKGTKPEEMLDIAQKLAELVPQNEERFEKITERDFKDYWILTRPERAKAKLTEKEWKKKDAYKLQLSRITEEDLSEITNDEMHVVSYFREMVSATSLTPKIIKKGKDGITTEELAIVSENLEGLPNIDVTTDWDRDLHVEILDSVLGSITSADEGLPADKLDYYLARGYSRDDRVGKSQLEEEYEDVLAGQKKKIRNITDKAGNVLNTEVINEGKSGNDLILSINFELQAEVEKIIEEELLATKKGKGARFLDRAYVVMMNPKTGEIYSLAGKEIKTKNGQYVVEDHALGTFTSAYAMGSAVKGATVLTGMQAGVINPGTVFNDRPMYFKGNTKPKGSYAVLGSVDDRNALKLSSNVYMFNIALKMMGVNYSPYMATPLKPEALDNMRSYFHQFGLGVKTEIDLPSESIGYPGKLSNPGLMLDYAIGQFDTYTPLQLAQYVSTIANDGYRMKPQIVKEIRQPTLENELGPVVKPFEPVVLNKIDMSDEYLDRVQEGFRRVMQEPRGTATAWFGNSPYNPAGKTGTAQSFVFERDENGKLKHTWSTYNLTLVGYAPYDNPEVAFAIVVPNLDTDKNPVNKKIGQRVLDKYFELKKATPTEAEGNEIIETEDQVPENEDGTPIGEE
ncbi:peptidoglycan D,D-transpeptidase FtsI family protein [Bacillus suaedaesalsae]|uniref:serine-type D-Ala-D-Ala carboxypeptidase n=1 Tax=Bacillus suaedaesalsae TaxID=2810349 RepID=A0ABS2DL04_9BACI|nr:penicillin-binding protein 2 [Bacillus suaedaesalsae]MBM6619176.1 penicillin-binding protein 2 [Bacillus suaedaesalsae]